MDRKSQMDGLFLFEDFVLGNCRISTGKLFCHHFFMAEISVRPEQTVFENLNSVF